MRSPLVRLVLAALLGATLAWRGLLWFNDYLDQREVNATRAAAEATAEAARRAGSEAIPTGPILSLPTEADLALLQTGDTWKLANAVQTLSGRQVTDTLEMAVDLALAQAPSDEHRALLTCLKMRYAGRDGLTQALALLPTDEAGYWDPPTSLIRLVEAVAEHAADEPARVRAALLPAIYSARWDVRNAAVAGLGRIALPDLPTVLETELQSPSRDRRTQALRAAIALGALRLRPDLVERALADEHASMRQVARYALSTAPEPAAARITARAIAAFPDDAYMHTLFRDREGRWADVSPALAELALDEDASIALRVSALGWLLRSGDHGVIPMIDALETGGNPEVREAAANALARLRVNRDKGITSHMRPLGEPRCP